MKGFGGFLLVTASVLLGELSFEELDEFGFEEHFVERDEDLDYHEHDLAESISEPDTVFYFELFSEHFRSVKSSQVTEFLVDDIELFSDEFFKHEDVLILINVVESIHIRS